VTRGGAGLGQGQGEGGDHGKGRQHEGPQHQGGGTPEQGRGGDEGQQSQQADGAGRAGYRQTSLPETQQDLEEQLARQTGDQTQARQLPRKRDGLEQGGQKG
jgi:hypothetical protein